MWSNTASSAGRLAWIAVGGQVAQEGKHIRFSLRGHEETAQLTARVAGEMKVSHCRDPNFTMVRHPLFSSPLRSLFP
jgi:hypothetical protein